MTADDKPTCRHCGLPLVWSDYGWTESEPPGFNRGEDGHRHKPFGLPPQVGKSAQGPQEVDRG